MTTQIGLAGAEITTSDPDAPRYKPQYPKIESSNRTLDSTLRTQTVALKRRWNITWAAQTGSARTNLLAELNRLVNLSWKPPEGGTYTVHASGIEEQPLSGATVYYDISCILEEV